MRRPYKSPELRRLGHVRDFQLYVLAPAALGGGLEVYRAGGEERPQGASQLQHSRAPASLCAGYGKPPGHA
jgi:hypothetical protein